MPLRINSAKPWPRGISYGNPVPDASDSSYGRSTASASARSGVATDGFVAVFFGAGTAVRCFADEPVRRSLVHQPRQALRPQRRIGNPAGSETPSPWSQFVPASRPGLLWNQTGQSVQFKRRLSLIERRREKPNAWADSLIGTLLHANCTQHLVLDLHQVVGVEEVCIQTAGVSAGHLDAE